MATVPVVPVVPHDYGCPNTCMREHVWAFEQSVAELGLTLDLELRRDAPHYSNGKTRIAYMAFVDTLK
jgi:hypothetical protein